MLKLTLVILMLIVSGPVQAQKVQPIKTIEAHSSSLLSLEFSPDGDFLASVGDDGRAKVWNMTSMKELFSINDARQNSNQVRFTTKGESVLTMSNSREIFIINSVSGKVVQTIKPPEVSGGPQSFDLSPDGKTIAVVGRSTLCTINMADGKLIATYEVHKGYAVNAVAWTRDGKLIATTGNDKTAAVINAADGKFIKSWPIRFAGRALAFTIDGKTLFVVSDDKTLRACQFGSDEPTTVIDKSVPLISLATSFDGSKLIMGGPGHAPWIMSIADHRMIDPTLDAIDWVKCAAISRDGKMLAGGSNNGSIYLWATP